MIKKVFFIFFLITYAFAYTNFVVVQESPFEENTIDKVELTQEYNATGNAMGNFTGNATLNGTESEYGECTPAC